MNRIILFVSSVALFAAALCWLGWTDQRSLIVIIVTLSIVSFLAWVMARSVTDSGPPTLSPDDSPLAALLFGGAIGLTLILCVLLGFGIAWCGGVWSPPSHKKPTTNRKTIAAREVSPAPAADEGRSLRTRIEAINFIQPMLFIELQVLDELDHSVESLVPNDFLVEVNRVVFPVHRVTPIPFEPSLNVAVLRDASGSVRGNPYPELIIAATNAVRQSLQSLPRSSSLRVADFSDAVADVSAWSSELATVVTTFTPAAARADRSAIVTSMAAVVDDLSQRHGGRRIVLISDGGNNVPADYSTAGLIAHARRNEVTIDVVALPTEHLQKEQRTFLQAIANETGGVYVDAATPTAMRDLQHALKNARDVRPAYRLAVDCPNEVRPELVTVGIRTRMESPSTPLTIIAQPSGNEVKHN